MATFIALISETQQGETKFEESVDRATRFKENAEKVGIQITGIYWTMGAYDGVLLFEAEKDETAVAFLHYVASKGTVRTQTLRAFDADATRSIIETMLKNQ